MGVRRQRHSAALDVGVCDLYDGLCEGFSH